MATYEKDGDNLKVTEPSETMMSMKELVAQKASIENDIAKAQEHFDTMSEIRSAQLERIDMLIAKAKELGVKDDAEVIEVVPVE